MSLSLTSSLSPVPSTAPASTSSFAPASSPSPQTSPLAGRASSQPSGSMPEEIREIYAKMKNPFFSLEAYELGALVKYENSLKPASPSSSSASSSASALPPSPKTSPLKGRTSQQLSDSLKSIDCSKPEATQSSDFPSPRDPIGEEMMRTVDSIFDLFIGLGNFESRTTPAPHPDASK